MRGEALRAKIEAGLREFDAGEGAELDIEEFIRQIGTEDEDG
jgi:predicted transcriptional regulator